jgi:hypothetical protein
MSILNNRIKKNVGNSTSFNNDIEISRYNYGIMKLVNATDLVVKEIQKSNPENYEYKIFTNKVITVWLFSDNCFISAAGVLLTTSSTDPSPDLEKFIPERIKSLENKPSWVNASMIEKWCDDLHRFYSNCKRLRQRETKQRKYSA